MADIVMADVVMAFYGLWPSLVGSIGITSQATGTLRRTGPRSMGQPAIAAARSRDEGQHYFGGGALPPGWHWTRGGPATTPFFCYFIFHLELADGERSRGSGTDAEGAAIGKALDGARRLLRGSATAPPFGLSARRRAPRCRSLAFRPFFAFKSLSRL